MSSDNKNEHSNFDQEKLKQYGKKFGYYFDIFYRVMKGLIGVVILLLFVGGALAGGTVIGYFASLVEDTPTPTHAEMAAEIHNYNRKSTLYYADNRIISDVQSDLLRTPISIENVSPLIIQGVIATEDENFFVHEGIVPKALIRAGVQELSGAPTVTGGSTLTQQLVKQQILSAEVTHSRKAVEILYATHLENSFEKEEILEAYMNISPFGRNNLGQNIAGVEEAAQGIFGVSASEVNLPQAAYLAGLPQSPITFNPYNQYGEVKEDLSAGIYRQQEVLYSMYREGFIDSETHSEAYNYDIAADFIARESDDNRNPHQSYAYDLVRDEARDILKVKLMQDDGLADERISELLNENRVVTEEMLETDAELAETINNNYEIYNEYHTLAENELINGGYSVHSTIDAPLHNAINQRINDIQGSFGANKTYEDANGEMQEAFVQVASTMIENETGRIMAFVGGRDYEISQHNNAFDTNRLSGSVLKPIFVFGPALAEEIITPATIIPDEAFEVPDGNSTQPISNIGPTTNRWRDVRHWLTVSQNIPTSRLYMQMLEENINVAQYVRGLGIGSDTITDGDFSNPSSALGGFSRGPTATEIAGAYAAIGNGGVFNTPYVIERIEDANGEVIYQHEPDPTRVWSEEVNYLLYDILRDVTGSIGTARVLPNFTNLNMDLASKTGTSDSDKDVWYAGVTPNVSLTTWMGYGGVQLNLEFSDGWRPSHRNIRNWANIMNVAYDVRPEIIGLNETVQQPSGITSESVLTATGMKAGNVELPNDDTVRASGQTKTEIFASNNVPGTTTYDFAAGASDEELEDFWSDIISSQRNSNDDDNDDEDSDEDENDSNDEDSSEEEDSEDSNEEDSDESSNDDNEEENNDDA